MGNSDPEELAQVQLGDIWQSRDVCKCLFDSTDFLSQGNLQGGLQFPLAKTFNIARIFLFQPVHAVQGHIEVIISFAIGQTNFHPWLIKIVPAQ